MKPLVVVLLLWANILWAEKSGRVAIAYFSSNKLVLADSSGNVVRSVPTSFKKEVFGISVNASGTKLIATLRTFGRGEFGGDFYLWTAQTGKWRQITHGPYVFRAKEEGHREVYADPAFSPDGQSIAFAIHDESLYDDNDIVDASGPAALMCLASSRVRVIKSTLGDPEKDPAGPPWFANTPQWSPDGKRLLLNFESGFAVIDLRSGRMQPLNPKIESGTSTYAVNWLDSRRLFMALHQDFSKAFMARTLKVDDGSITEAPENFREIGAKLLGFNSEVWVVEDPAGSEVHGRSVWRLPKSVVFGLAPKF